MSFSWSWQREEKGMKSIKLITGKRTPGPVLYNVSTCVLPVLFSGVWVLSHTSAPWGGSEAYAVSLTSDRNKNVHSVKIQRSLAFKLFYNEADESLHLCEHSRRRLPGGFVQNGLWQIFFKPVQVILSDKGQVLWVICGFRLPSGHVAFDKSERDWKTLY